MSYMYAQALRETVLDCLRKVDLQDMNCRACLGTFFHAVLLMLEREISVSDAAQIAGKSPCQIRRMVRNGELSRRGGNGERMRLLMAEIPMSKEQRLAVFKVVRDIAAVLTKDR